MLFYLIGKKLGMTRLFVENGDIETVTVIEAGPCPVVQIKTEKTDGYNAVQLGYADKKERNVTKPLLGHFKKAGVASKRCLRESLVDNVDDYSLGQEFKVDIFEKGDFVDVVGISKGKGFAGVMKRHGFSGGRKTHGGKAHRHPGSIGMAATPARVFKGTKLPGQMGNVRKTVQNLEVIDVRLEQNQVLVKGAVPGANNSIVYLRHSKKKPRKQ